MTLGSVDPRSSLQSIDFIVVNFALLVDHVIGVLVAILGRQYIILEGWQMLILQQQH